MSAIGKKGPKGDTGATGATGATGPEGPPGTTTWAGITDKPSTFPPEAHHTSHETGGSDPIELSDIIIKYAIALGD